MIDETQVEITDEAMVPDEYCRLSGSMPLWIWVQVKDALACAARGSGGYVLRCTDALAEMERCVGMKREVSKSAVAEALAKPCPKCGHTAHVGASWNNSAATPCEECGGSGRQGVPGARLLPRGESVVIK